MKSSTLLSLFGTAGALCLVAGSACSSSNGSTANPTTGGMGGDDPGSGGAATGGAATGGSAGAATGGSAGAAMGGNGPVDCTEDQWADPEDGSCHACPADVPELTCETDFWDEDSEDNGTHWDPETQTLVLQQAPGKPPAASAIVSFDYCWTVSDCARVTSPMTVDGYTLSATFNQLAEPVAYTFDMELSMVDACGNEIEVDRPVSFVHEDEAYTFYCEGSVALD